MKITFVLPPVNLTGGIRVVAIYAKLLKKRGHNVFIVSTPKPKPTLRQRLYGLRRGQIWQSISKQTPSHLDHIDVPHHVIDCHRPITDADVPDADVIVATCWETAEWVARLSSTKGAKAYFIQHYEIHDYLPRDRVEATWRLPIHKITIAQWLVDIALTQYGDHQVSLVPNSVDTQQFNAPIRQKQAIPTVGIMYSPVRWKGCDISLKAVSLARQKIPRLRLLAFGMQEPWLNLPLPEGTEYILQPPQDTIKNIYNQCDAWLFGSRYEGFGLPILEAMACRTPVIGTPTGAAPELLSQGGGLLVKSEDPEDMARAIEQIYQCSNHEWQAMSEKAYITATHYTWDDATTRFETALQTAIKRQQ